MARILLDADGILVRFTKAFSHHLGEDFEENDCPSWRVYPKEFEKAAISKAMKYAHSREGMEYAGSIEGAVAGVNRLFDHGHELYVCTRRGFEYAKPTKEVLREWGFRFQHYYAHPGVNKITYCQERDIEILVDDKPETLLKAQEANLSAYSLRWAYNAYLEHEPNITLAADWDELCRLLLPL